MLKKKILLAEDDVDDQLFFIDFLQHRTDIILMPVVQDGVKLLDQLNNINKESELPDYIILDQNMPKQNGIETLQLLKQDPRYFHIPVIIYSTYADKSLIEKGAQAGACLVASKPVLKEEYDELINTLLIINAV